MRNVDIAAVWVALLSVAQPGLCADVLINIPGEAPALAPMPSVSLDYGSR